MSEECGDRIEHEEVDISDVSEETLEDVAFEIRELACHVGWTDPEAELEYDAIADHLLELRDPCEVELRAVETDSPDTLFGHVREFVAAFRGEARD